MRCPLIVVVGRRASGAIQGRKKERNQLRGKNSSQEERVLAKKKEEVEKTEQKEDKAMGRGEVYPKKRGGRVPSVAERHLNTEKAKGKKGKGMYRRKKKTDGPERVRAQQLSRIAGCGGEEEGRAYSWHKRSQENWEKGL